MVPFNTNANTEMRVFQFVKILHFCIKNDYQQICINLQNFNSSNGVLEKKIRFIYSAFSVENSVKSNCELIFTDLAGNFEHGNIDSTEFNLPKEYDNLQFSFGLNDLMIKNYETISLPKNHDNVVLGGTFDRLHNGHRLLLSIAAVLAKSSINIGITSKKMTRGKILAEIIQNYEIRKLNVENYIKIWNPNLVVRFDKLNDRIGFSGTESIFDTLVTTLENADAISVINNERKANKINELESFIIDQIVLLTNISDRFGNDHKRSDSNDIIKDRDISLTNLVNTSNVQPSPMSSTYLRCQQMGKLLKPHRLSLSFPYIIGVTGCIASGKTTICQYLSELGADVIDCDHEARECYLPNTQCYSEVIGFFGADILRKDSNDESNLLIDRKKLGGIVFNDYSKMDKLNSIVWPHLYNRVVSLISKKAKQGVRVIVIEAAILFESNLVNLVHEIWLCVVPEKTALMRIQERNRADSERAKKMYDCTQRLISSFKKAKDANIVFSTHMEADRTKEIVVSVWNQLNKRISDSA